MYVGFFGRMSEDPKQPETTEASKPPAPAAQPLSSASTNTTSSTAPASKPQGTPLVCNNKYNQLNQLCAPLTQGLIF